MLYSDSDLLLNTPETLLAGDRVFVGNQPDDFALAGIVTESQVPRVCFLGLGFGGALRPILAAAPGARIVAVESDSSTAELCRAIYRRYFPQVDFEVAVQDAARIGTADLGDFDVVCVDLYESAGYPRVVFQTPFWNDVRSMLRPTGVVLVNLWGLPEHLRWYVGLSAQARLATLVSNTFGRTRYLPYRRNTTLIAGDRDSDPPSCLLRVDEKLNALDRVICQLLPARLSHAPDIPSLDEVDSAAARATGSRHEIDGEMHARWPELTSTFQKSASDLGLISQGKLQLRAVLAQPELARMMTNELLSAGRPEADFVPVAVAANVFVSREIPEWYLGWVVNDCEYLYEQDPRWVVNVFLWQALAMLVNPYAARPVAHDEVLNVAKRIAECETDRITAMSAHCLTPNRDSARV
jgi:hypothetical protein